MIISEVLIQTKTQIAFPVGGQSNGYYEKKKGNNYRNRRKGFLQVLIS